MNRLRKHFFSDLLKLSILFQLSDLKTNVDGLEKERDFYFGKLRDIEVICQEADFAGTELSQKILEILYATEVSYIDVILMYLETYSLDMVCYLTFCCAVKTLEGCKAEVFYF